MPGIRDILTELGIPFVEGGQHHHVQPGWLGVDCNACSPNSGKYKLGIHPRTLATTCWSCGRQRIGTALSAASGRPLKDVLKLLPHITDDSHTAPARPRGKFRPPEGVEPLLKPHRRYLAGRGFDPDEITSLWDVAALGPFGEHPWRLYIPVRMNDVDVSWTTRAIGADTLRYRAADPADESVPIHNTLYGWDHVRHCVIVTEGPFDAMAVGPGSVCTFGLNVTPVQVALLSSVPVRVVLMDNEPNAQRRASRLVDDLSIWPGETYLARLSGKDPASSPRDEIEELRSKFSL